MTCLFNSRFLRFAFFHQSPKHTATLLRLYIKMISCKKENSRSRCSYYAIRLPTVYWSCWHFVCWMHVRKSYSDARTGRTSPQLRACATQFLFNHFPLKHMTNTLPVFTGSINWSTANEYIFSHTNYIIEWLLHNIRITPASFSDCPADRIWLDCLSVLFPRKDGNKKRRLVIKQKKSSSE